MVRGAEVSALTPRRRSQWLWLIPALLLFLIAGLPGGLWFWVRVDAARRWAKLLAELEVLTAQSNQRGGPRPTHHDPPAERPLDDDSWFDYAQGIQNLPWPEQPTEYEEILEKNKPEIAGIAESSSLSLQCLRNGAHKSIAGKSTFEPEWVKGQRELGMTAICAARHFRQTGRRSQAFELLLDTAVFGRDIADNALVASEVRGYNTLIRSCDELRTHVPDLSPSECLLLIKAMEAIDRHFPQEGLALLNTVVWFGREHGPQGTWEGMVGGRKIKLQGPYDPGWRFAWCERAMDVDALQRWLFIARRAMEAGQGSWEEAKAAELQARKLLTMGPPNGRAELLPIPTPSRRRDALARVRLLRMAAAYRARVAVPALQDPYSDGPLQQKGGAFWSAGATGDDPSLRIDVKR